VLRLIGCLDLMQAFVVEGKGDEGLPYQIKGLPADLKADESVAGMFLERQGLVLEGVEKGEEKEEEKGESGKPFLYGFSGKFGTSRSYSMFNMPSLHESDLRSSVYLNFLHS
jgi:hypothetical protein